MRLNVCSCLLLSVVGWKLTAAIIHQIVEEKTSVTLPCPRVVDSNVTWSREKDGRKVDIITIDVDRDTRYNTLADKSLFIGKLSVSDAGRYFCNEAAVELTVIPAGTIRREAPQRTSVILTCSHVEGSDFPTWSRNNVEIQQQQGKFQFVDMTLIIRDVQPEDSGLYYCDGKPAAYLNVTKGDETTTTTTTRPTTAVTTTTKKQRQTRKPRKEKEKNKDKKSSTTTTTTTTPSSSTSPPAAGTPTLVLVVGIVVVVLLLLLFIIIIIDFTRRRRSKKQGSEQAYAVYEEIQDGCVTLASNGVSSFAGASYSMADFPGKSNQTVDPTYCTIPSVQPKENTENPYSVIPDASVGGNNKGLPQLSDTSTYFLLQKPKIPENNNY